MVGGQLEFKQKMHDSEGGEENGNAEDLGTAVGFHGYWRWFFAGGIGSAGRGGD